MIEKVKKFRKICNALAADRGFTRNKIADESGISLPTVKKLLDDPIDVLKVQASVLGKIQDYNKKHNDDLLYADVVPTEKEAAKGITPRGKKDDDLASMISAIRDRFGDLPAGVSISISING